MKLILNILLMVGIAVSGLAQTPKTELEVLTDNYNKAKERAVKPIEDKYKEELKRLLEKYSKQGNVVEVEKITPLLRIDSQLQLNDPLEKSEWKSATGTVWQFLSNGRGIKTNGTNQTSFTWKRVGDIVEMRGRDSINSSERKWWAKEQTLDTIKYGDEMFLLDGTLKRTSN